MASGILLDPPRVCLPLALQENTWHWRYLAICVLLHEWLVALHCLNVGHEGRASLIHLAISRSDGADEGQALDELVG